MRRIVSVCLGLLAVFSTGAAAEFDPDMDYMGRMVEAAVCADTAAGEAAQGCRAEKIAALGLDCTDVAFEDLWLLSRLIENEAGSAWLDADWKMAVGEVALNRVASPEFPNTLGEVLAQPGQYHGALFTLRPSLASVEAAKRLLEGERVLRNPSVVFQSNAPQGGGVFRTLRDAALGATYFCYSSRPELYIT